MSTSGDRVQVSNMILHGYDLDGFRRYRESFQELHRKGSGKLGLTSGFSPDAGLIVDAAGDLFGTTSEGGPGSGAAGTVFELVNNGGSYTLTTMVTFNGTDGAGPQAGLIADAAGNLFGTTDSGGVGDGTVFELTDTGFVVCYARGTMIRTPDGELPIEKLRRGKQVITLIDGEEVPQTVTWLGHRRISLAGHPRPETVAPIRIERDAIADGMPHRDLLVSPDHAIFVDGMLICARQLMNGTTIRRELDWTAVDYYHAELDEHAILLAEGLPAESYLDTGNSGFFANSGAPLVLHPDLTDETDYPTREANSCAPFVSDEANVRPVWQRLADRAAAIARAGSPRVTTTDVDLRLVAHGRTIKPVFSDSQRVIFALPSARPSTRSRR